MVKVGFGNNCLSRMIIDKESRITVIAFISVIVGCFTVAASSRIIHDYERLSQYFGNLTYLLISTILLLVPGLLQFLSSLFLLCKHNFLRRWVTINSYVFLTLIVCLTFAIPSTYGPYKELRESLQNITTGQPLFKNLSLSSVEGAAYHNYLNDSIQEEDFYSNETFETQVTQDIKNMTEILGIQLDNATNATDGTIIELPSSNSTLEIENESVEEKEDEVNEKMNEYEFNPELYPVNSTSTPIVSNHESKKEEEDAEDLPVENNSDIESKFEVISRIKLFYGVILLNFLFLPISLGLMAGIVDTRRIHHQIDKSRPLISRKKSSI